jgi:hypothetical protein
MVDEPNPDADGVTPTVTQLDGGSATQKERAEQQRDK